MAKPIYRVYIRLPNSQQVDRNNKTNTPDLGVALAAFWGLLDQYPEPSEEPRAAVLSLNNQQQAYICLDSPLDPQLEIQIEGITYRRPAKEQATMDFGLAHVRTTLRPGDPGTKKSLALWPEMVKRRI